MPRHPLDVTWTPPAPLIEIGVAYPDQPVEVVDRTRAPVDTGADVTVVPQSFVEHLLLPQAGQLFVAGFSSETTAMPAYAVVIAMDGCAPRAVRAIVHDDDEAILGRGLLQHVVVTVDGPRGFVEVTASSPGAAG